MNRNKNQCKDKTYTKSNNKQRNGKNKGNNQRKFNYEKEKEYFQQKTDNPATDYFSDQQLAEQNSYVSNRSIIDSAKTMEGTNIPYPTVIVHAYNPSVSVSPVDFVTKTSAPSPLSQAASKLLIAIMANTGRINNYTKNDIIGLITMLGQFVAMTEYGRRTFGLYNKFNMINRDIPKQFIEACGFDWDDFVDNYYIYLSRMNWLINLSAQFVIPMDKIPYLRRCRDRFSKVYKDSAGGMTTYHINVPYSTWILEEHTLEGGSLLKSVNVTGPHHARYYIRGDVAESSVSTGSSKLQPHSIWTFGEFLDNVYAPLIDSIFNSNTFNLIFSDLRNAKFQTQYSFEFWHAELITSDYQAEVLDPQDDVMTLYHNTSVVGAPLGDHTTYNESGYPLFTRYNDVQLIATDDAVVYNPSLLTHSLNGEFDWNDPDFEITTAREPIFYYHDDAPIIMDFKDDSPSLDLRVDTMMQLCAQYDNMTNDWLSADASLRKFASTNNWVLPLWYCVGVYAKSEYVMDVANLSYDGLLADENDLRSDVFNGWMVINHEGTLVLPVLGLQPGGLSLTTNYNLSAVRESDTYDARPQVGSLVTVKTNRETNAPGTLVKMNYLGGAQYRLIPYKVPEEWALEGSALLLTSRYNASGFYVDVDYWYALPFYKLINMFDHAYQHLFTADGIIQ